MAVLNAIIVDDERLARVNLQKLLAPFEQINLVGEAADCKAAVDQINIHRPDVVFLDIQLKGEKGFDLLNKINANIKIVFVTAYDEYAIRAFEINAVDYLLKPVIPERLQKTIERILNDNNIKKEAEKKFEYTDSVLVKLDSYSSVFIKVSDIVHIEPVGNYSSVFTANSEKYTVLKTLKQWITGLPPDKFIRIHRSQIVNMEYLVRIEKYSDNYHRLYLKNSNDPFEISRRYMSNLKKNFHI